MRELSRSSPRPALRKGPSCVMLALRDVQTDVHIKSCRRRGAHLRNHSDLFTRLVVLGTDCSKN
ncbi:hypothetical protein SCHPADRAFT_355756 [Schizopora paradoxa]|uniref:Uncharacterized protein n=1 Tax=Schizopora paradoxa TaxID=27342 RepID=A0A0H2RVZ1_9AGAM|nr:hypothetical protein SCHPADRAFT_355756 [Schizopora paradoxa]